VFAQPKEFVRSSGLMSRKFSATEAQSYTRWLATHHYENFHVVSLLLPKRLHQDFFNVYAFCRWADDLSDEIGNPAESLRLLEWWSDELKAMFAGRATHPVFVALMSTVERHALPAEPFENLIRAFIQDQTVTRYATWDDLFAYCRWSADPVGRLVLGLCGYSDAERYALSDATCTALQLANFWQDIAVDLEKNRVYIPLNIMARHRYTVEDLEARRYTPEFRNFMQELVTVTRELFERGLPLAGKVDRRLGIDIELFSRGGLLILDKIADQNYDVLSRRPAVSKTERAWLLFTTLARRAFSRAA
jgi:squalene synthase HpnC